MGGKLLLAGSAALAVAARLRLIPNHSHANLSHAIVRDANVRDANLSGLAWHIRSSTAPAIDVVVVSGLIRRGSLG